MFKKTYIAAAAIALTFAGAANAALVTDHSTYTGPALDLTAFQTGAYNFTFGPVALPNGLTFTRDHSASNSGNGAVVGQGSYGLGANGNFGGAATYIGLDGPNATGTFALAAPVSSIGFFFNYAPGVGGPATIAALDSNGVVFESYNLEALAPISTPGGFNAFEFRGITDLTADIYSFQISGAYILATGTSSGVVVSSVPEPDSLALMALGLGAVGFMARRRKA